MFTVECAEKGGLKRSGGQGDVLAGCLGTFSAWSDIAAAAGVNDAQQQSALSVEKETLRCFDLCIGAWAACSLTRNSSLMAYRKHKRSMTAPDVIAELGDTMERFSPAPEC